jgi:hypothetical protein
MASVLWQWQISNNEFRYIDWKFFRFFDSSLFKSSTLHVSEWIFNKLRKSKMQDCLRCDLERICWKKTFILPWECVPQHEWGWTARNAIARQSFARHFWQQINCSTQILSTARIQLILAKPDSSKWQKKWQLLDTVEQLSFFLRQ